jgi:hypothetical protein
MVYGPFSLANVTAADLSFKLWLNSEIDYDGVCRLASINGNDFYGTCTSGNSNGWSDRRLDLANVPGLGNLIGRSEVWIALVFSSDESVTEADGAYVDNIVLRKFVSGASAMAPVPPSIQPAAEPETLVEVSGYRMRSP